MICPKHLGVDCSSRLKQNPGLIVLAFAYMEECHVVLGVGTAHMVVTERRNINGKRSVVLKKRLFVVPQLTVGGW
jgi:hypothetical protein